MNLNPTQQLAVNTLGQNTLVFASAGGGKTTVLIERLMKRILVDGVSIDEILAMTFTDAASGEMKKRLEKSLTKAIELDPTNDFLKHQKTLLQDAHISTIHSFCLDLVKEYYYVIGLSKSCQNNILDEGTKKLYQDEAFERVAYKYKELAYLNESLTSSLFSFDDLKKYVLAILKSANNYFDPELWFEENRSHTITSFDELKEGIKEIYLQELKGQLIYAISIIDKIIDLHNEFEASFILKKTEFEALLDEEDYNYFEHQLSTYLVKIPTNKDEEYKALRIELTNIFKEIASLLLPEKVIVERHNQLIPLESLLLNLSRDVYRQFGAIKKENDCIDFDDFEHFAYQILVANDFKIAKELKNRFKEIMIDEFQDTNSTQYKIASLIEHQNLFLVGDIKQSIYRFRGAKPSIMQSLKNREDFFKIHIKNNYRSKENVVEFNNELFKKLMNILSNDYDEEDLQIAGLDRQKEDNVPVEFIYLKSNESIKELKAKRIANEILKLHKKGEAFKDIAVLVRGHNDKVPLKKTFEAYNIPYFIKDNEGYYNSTAISILISYLKFLMSPKDRALQAALLSSSLYNLNDNDLVYLKDNFLAYEPLSKDYERLKELAYKNRILDCVNEILMINDFYLKHLNLQERSNFDVFINDLKRLNFNTLYDLIDYIQETQTYQKEAVSTINEDADVVKVMTIHNSKGLEFENVFFYSTSINSQRERREAVVTDDYLGIGLRASIDEHKNTIDNIARIAILAKDNRDDLNEFIRLLYVTLTRAKRRLYIVDGGKELVSYPINEALLYARKGFTSLIYNVMNDHPLLNLKIEYDVEDLKPLPKPISTQSTIPSKEFKFILKESIAPSSLEIQDELNFDALKGMEYGTKVHAIFEHLDFHKNYTEEILKADFKDIDRKTIQAVLSFTNHPLIQEIKNDELIPEFSFYLNEEDALYHGFMDFVAIGKERILLIDYKTDHEDDPAVFVKRYTPQIEAYKDILIKIFHKEVHSYLYSTHLATFIAI